MSDARLDQTRLLDEPVSTVRLVNAARDKQLARLGIRTRRDLIENFPRRYLDMSNVVSAVEAPIGQTVTVVGRVADVTVKRPRPRLVIVEASLVDDTGVLFGTWFRQPWMADRIHPGDQVAFSGKVEFNYGYKRMNSPFFEVLSSQPEHDAADSGGGASSEHGGVPRGGSAAGRVIAIHPLTEGISSAWMRRFVATALEDADAVCDPIPVRLRMRRDLLPRAAAWRSIHFPSTLAEAGEARRRLVYEELLELQLYLLGRRRGLPSGSRPVRHVTDGPVRRALVSALPFALSDEQLLASSQIDADMGAERVMNRMLLGDVGTGKTVVALLALANAVDSGMQGCMMAPTSVLAEQYAVKLGPLLDEVGVSWARLTGAVDASERARIIEGLASGAIKVVFGTHALLEDDVVFSALSLVIIDEEHRFGVAQRLRLRAKGPRSDLLVMTATPIPRTLALTLYGDLDCSYLRKRPRQAPPTSTTVLTKQGISRAYAAVQEACDQGRQAYIVCPLVGVRSKANDDERSQELADRIAWGDDVTDMKAAEQEANLLSTKVFPTLEVGLMTGRMAAEEKADVMERFRSGQVDVLVSTTVIEVGVDVPNATVMVVHDAERFGLAQLHQLRGRVSRGSHPGEVYLVSSSRAKAARERLDALARTTDGFELAEQDLRQRREGDVLGCRQHGLPSMKLLDVRRDGTTIRQAHDDARELMEHDPGLAGPVCAPLGAEVALRFGSRSEEDA